MCNFQALVEHTHLVIKLPLDHSFCTTQMTTSTTDLNKLLISQYAQVNSVTNTTTQNTTK